MTPRPTALRGVLLLLGVVVYGSSCRESNALQTIQVSLRNTETYHYPTLSGDEDIARIATQAAHYSVSQIRRDAATNWEATYVYQPASGFVGSNYVELELLTGSDGASPPTDIKRVALRFVVHE